MHVPLWFWPSLAVLITWGVVGLLQKLSTNYLTAESALIWLVVGLFFLDLWLLPSQSIFSFSVSSLIWTFLSAFLNALGAWALLAAMKHGGKASIVVPFTALYPVVTVFLAWLVLDEDVARPQAVGIMCALAAIVLLST